MKHLFIDFVLLTTYIDLVYRCGELLPKQAHCREKCHKKYTEKLVIENKAPCGKKLNSLFGLLKQRIISL